MHDINNRVGHQLKRGQLKGSLFSDILYADDTLLICSNAKTTNMYLRQIIIESEKYSMKLNNDKCESLVFNAESKVKFPDGTDMECVNNATYLGGIIANAKGNAAQIDIRNRIQQACTTAKALYPFFKKAACSIAWKIQVYNATMKAQLMYGLETSALSTVQLQQLDTFQQRGLRAILNIEPAWISRISNESVMSQAKEALGK